MSKYDLSIRHILLHYNIQHSREIEVDRVFTFRRVVIIARVCLWQ